VSDSDGWTSKPIPADYDSDPARFAANQAATASFSTAGDLHALVAQRLHQAGVAPVLDLGGGNGQLARHLRAARVSTVVVDPAVYVRQAPKPAIRADARALPFVDRSFGAVAALWMLYHLPTPRMALLEVSRVLRPRGLFVACTSSRRNDPEFADVLPGWGDAFVFDAESAVDVVASAFDVIDVQRWDAPMMTLPDQAAVELFLRGRGLSLERSQQAAEGFSTPMTVTKRGALIWAIDR
jgi:SAM-dependent methyltransferase